MLLQAALNGDLTKDDHPALPISVEELVNDAMACVRAGARAFHIHPRDRDGLERLDADVVDRVVVSVREATRVPVGVSTGAWIEPDVERRVALVSLWQAPDYATVNLSEEGAADVMRALIGAGVGIEAGIWTVNDADRLAATGMGDEVLRICVEPVDLEASRAATFVEDIHRALDRLGLAKPRLQHGDGAATWVLLTDAIRRGIDTRIGLEDTQFGPGGQRMTGNEALVQTAHALGAGNDRW
jgi:uncharacterized protein (DUF849 family)